MIHRILGQVTTFLTLILILASVSASSQSIVSLTRPDNSICPDTIYYASVNVSEIQDVDSIFISVTYDPQVLNYISFRQVNTVLNQNGTAQVVDLNENTVTFKWDATGTNAVSLTNTKLLDLLFETKPGSDNVRFNESVSVFRTRQGTNLEVTYIGAPVNIFPRIAINIEEINATCPNSCDANIAAFASNGVRPYTFLWGGKESVFDSVFAGACGGPLLIQVKDANNCKLDTIFNVSLLDSALVELMSDPDTVYMQNPVVTFSFEADASVVDWTWDFGDGSQQSKEQNPFHVYSRASDPNIDGFMARLITVSESGCTKTDSIFLTISELPIFIPNVFTPNKDDQINNYFKIAKKINDTEKVPIDSEYMRMELIVLDRWGRRVYENLNYKNDWDGDNLPDGTYYYKLNTYGYYKNESFKGSVTILR
ncbi:MAG: gliding motility-associated C-terminal domain-containing protein [Chloroflexota bacterium]